MPTTHKRFRKIGITEIHTASGIEDFVAEGTCPQHREVEHLPAGTQIETESPIRITLTDISLICIINLSITIIIYKDYITRLRIWLQFHSLIIHISIYLSLILEDTSRLVTIEERIWLTVFCTATPSGTASTLI